MHRVYFCSERVFPSIHFTSHRSQGGGAGRVVAPSCSRTRCGGGARGAPSSCPSSGSSRRGRTNRARSPSAYLESRRLPRSFYESFGARLLPGRQLARWAGPPPSTPSCGGGKRIWAHRDCNCEVYTNAKTNKRSIHKRENEQTKYTHTHTHKRKCVHFM